MTAGEGQSVNQTAPLVDFPTNPPINSIDKFHIMHLQTLESFATHCPWEAPRTGVRSILSDCLEFLR